MSEPRIIVDADACPRACLEIIRRLAAEYHWEILTVASVDHRIDHSNHLTVGDEPQAVDLVVMNQTRPGEIVVTQDWGLAAMVLAKGAAAIAPTGRIYEPDRIEFMLEERNLAARWRRGGGRTKGPRPRNSGDDRNFEAGLRQLLTLANGIQ